MALILLAAMLACTTADKWANPCQSATGETATFMLNKQRQDSLLCISQTCYDENTIYTNRQTQGYGSTFAGYSMDLPLTLWYSEQYTDNYVATTATPPDGTYTTSFNNGYIFSSNGPGRIPLNLYYNKAKKDHATLANKTLEQQLISQGYVLLGTQGYIFDVNANTNGTNTNQSPYCDMQMDFESRAKDLVYNVEFYNTVFLATYQGLSGNGAYGIDNSGDNAAIPVEIPPYQWWSEALHGVAGSPGVNYDGPIKSTTMFPQVITTGSTFNRSLFFMIGDAISTEARAMWNNAQAGLTFWAPNINIFRDPRWGRGQETPGEDPHLTEVYAGHFVRGMQGNDNKYLKVSSCCKHFADYSMENSDNSDRFRFNALVSEYDQNDTYLVAFRSCVVNGNVSGIMCSYNAENGIPSCANKDLMTNYLRNELGFYGYITSDCGAVECVQSQHHYTNDTGSTIQAVFGAGMDSDCGGYTQANTLLAVESGSAQLEDVQAATYRSTLVQMRLGLFDPQSMQPWVNLGVNDVNTKHAQQISYEAAQQGMVLLKNINNALPIQNNLNIALIGPNANNGEVMKGNYYGNPPFIYTVQQGIQQHVAKGVNVNYEKGCDINSDSTVGFQRAIQAAENSDVTILVMGIDQSIESEGNDRRSIDLPGQQNNLIGNITASSKVKKVILVLITGGCVDIAKWKNNDKVSAIIWGGYPGQFGGLAVADVIYGTFNPTGLLDQTWYFSNYTSQVQMVNMDMRPNGTVGPYGATPGRGYRYFNGSVIYEFGYGLSFSTFACSNMTVNNDAITANVKNNGNVNGGAVVLVYWVPTNAGRNGVENKRLVGFEGVNMISSGSSAVVNMKMYDQFYYSQEYKTGDGKLVFGGACLQNSY